MLSIQERRHGFPYKVRFSEPQEPGSSFAVLQRVDFLQRPLKAVGLDVLCDSGA